MTDNFAKLNEPNTLNYRQEDEIDLFQLLENLWKQKILITLITLACMLVGLAYAVFATPEYKASTTLNVINQGASKPLTSLPLYPEIMTDSLLHEFIATVSNAQFQKQFVSATDSSLKQALYPGATTEEEIKELLDRYKLVVGDEKKEWLPRYKLEFTAYTADIAADELNRLINSASQYLVNNIRVRYEVALLNENNRINREITSLENQLAAERTDKIVRIQEAHKLALQELQDQLAARQKTYLSRLSDRIVDLTEAYSIAKALNIETPITLNKMARDDAVKMGVNADLSGQNSPLYLRGTRLLSKELEQLKSRSADYYPDSTVRELEAKILEIEHNREVEMLRVRTSDHPFSEKIQSLSARAFNLKNNTFPATIQLDFSQYAAVANPRRVAPKRVLIVLLSGVMGGIIGVIFALIRSGFLAYKQRKIGES